MSTRSQIGFYEKKTDKLEDFQALLYRHHDGYPGSLEKDEYGVLTCIVPFLKWFQTERGLDCEYASARLLQWMCNQSDGFIQFEEPTSWNKKPFTGVLSYGVCKDFHGDIEYFYKIYPYAVEVYEVRHGEGFKLDLGLWKLIQTIDLNEKK